jgi:hypothetical protein
MNFQLMHKQRKLILIAAIVGIISIFLPWITISAGGPGLNMSVNRNGFHGSGVVVFLAFAATVILVLTGDEKMSLRRTSWIIALALGLVALLFIGICMSNLSGVTGGYGLVDASIGFGLWIALAASLGILGSAWLLKSPGDSIKLAIDEMKINMNSSGSLRSGTGPVSGPPSGKVTDLERLIELRNQNKITEEEYQQMKSKLL